VAELGPRPADRRVTKCRWSTKRPVQVSTRNSQLCIKSGSPMILICVVSTKRSACDPTNGERRLGGRRGLHKA
jgi:hypothetical protein